MAFQRAPQKIPIRPARPLAAEPFFENRKYTKCSFVFAPCFSAKRQAGHALNIQKDPKKRILCRRSKIYAVNRQKRTGFPKGIRAPGVDPEKKREFSTPGTIKIVNKL